MAAASPAMSQFRDHPFQQSSPASYSGGGADAGNVTGTPNSRMIAFSPSAKSVKSASKLLHTPDREGSENNQTIFSPTHSSGGGFRTTGASAASVDKDPFVTPSSKNKAANQQLSATASSFRPFYDSISSDGSGETQPRAPEESDNTRSSQSADHISPVLSTELLLSRCLEFSCSNQAVAIADIEAYLAKLASLGSPCQGNKQFFTKNSKVYVRFTNIRDACVSHRNVHLCGSGWAANFIQPPDFVQAVMSGDTFANNHEGQLDMLAVLLHNAPMELSQVEPLVFKLLKAEGDLFAFQKDPRSEDGALKAIVEYSDFTVALNVASKLNGVMVDGLHIRLGHFYPSGHTGRAAPQNDGVTTPMPTPGRYRPPENTIGGFQGQPAVPFPKPTPPPGAGGMIPGRHQPTPPTSGVGGPPQVALVPMVLRNPYTPGAPLILDPYGPHGSAMTTMGGSSLVFPPGGPVPSLVGPHGFDGGPRSMAMANRYGNRRGAMRIDRSMQFNQNGHHNQVDVNRIRDGVDVRTTIMLRNIPNKVDQRMLKAIIDESSWGKYDFMYLRIDFANDCNVGYAFINFADPLDIIDFANARDNQRWNCFRSDKVAEISYATIQGRDCLVQKFRNSSVMLEAPHYRPKLYYTVSGTNPELAGREEEFPGPDNPSKMKRSCENAEHVGLFTPHLSQYYRDEQRRRRSQYDRGTRMAALEEYDYETTLQRMYMQH